MVVLWQRIKAATGKIRDTEWLLLFLEGLSVVVGVLIAFQLQQWGDDQRSKIEQERLMHRLLDEARQDLSYLRGIQAQNFERLQEAGSVVMSMNARTCPSADEFEGLWGVDAYPSMTPPDTVYQEMINGAGLSSIEDQRAREAIVDYRTSVDFIDGQIQFFRPDVSLTDLGINGLSYYYDPERRRLARIEVDTEAVCANPTFSNYVNKAVRNQHRMQQYRYMTVQAAAHMCFELARIVGEKCFDGPLASLTVGDREELIEMDSRLHSDDLTFHKSD